MMSPKKIIIHLLFTLLIIIIPLTISANKKNDVRYEFIQTDSTLSFYGNFKIDKNPNCLLEIFLNFKHIKALASDALEVQLVDQGCNWNRFRYIYQKFIFFENISVWHRKLDMEKQRVDIILESSVNNMASVPRMISSSGFFQIIKQGDEIIVVYHQECQLTKSSITNLLLSALKNEAIHFMKKLFEYSNTICGDKPVTDN